jgi:16S rRNA processing protein RimM
MSANSQWSLLARILRPQGRAGEVLAQLFTDFPARFSSHPDVLLAEPGFSDMEPALQAQRPAPEPARLTGHWLPVGRNAGRVVLQFAGVDSISAAELLSGKEVVVPADARMPLEPDAAYISDLVGCMVYDAGTPVGILQDVEFATAPDGVRRLEQAAPLLVVTSSDGDEILIPFAKQYVLDVNVGARAVRMQLPEGLTQINARETR